MRSLVLALSLALVPGTRARLHTNPSPPKLVVVIVIDQFRADYPQQFRSYFSPGGINLFFQRGAVFSRARYEHGVLFTCPGHAVVMTGSYADVNGIVSNYWYDQKAGREEYCAADSSASLVGAGGAGRSPRYLLDSTFGDVLKGASGGLSRVITLSGKDRAAIMLGGHLADAAYWTLDTLFVTSTYYEKELPRWVRGFNASGKASAYLGRPWTRLLPAGAYAATGPDDVATERSAAGMGRTFPHRPPAGSPHDSLIEAFETSPFHNELLAEFAMQAIVREGLGRHRHPDLLAIGLSANDLIGHAYGPNSHEVMDATIRTDRLLERLFQFLDRRVGLANVIIVVTGDHGVAPLPEVMQKRDPRAGAARLDPAVIPAAAEAALRARYGSAGASSWIAHHDYPYLYLNLAGLRRKGASVKEAELVAKKAVQEMPGVQQAVTATELIRQRRQGVHSNAERSFFPGRSGNVYYQLAPYVIPQERPEGTSHGAIWPYDTDVPLLWFGPGIVPGEYAGPAAPSDIAPTLSALLGIAEPSGSEGRILKEMLR
ncbi:MAG: alkaline phosphatase family protein [Gemmatimonadales bacterium]